MPAKAPSLATTCCYAKWWEPLDNAIRHSSSQVRVEIGSAAQAISITVTNDGATIPPEQRDRIFDRFVRLDPAVEGAGLGLPIARWIAEAHGGR